MKIVISGVKYDFLEALAGAELGNLLKLKLATKTPDFKGVTVKTIQASFAALGGRSAADDFDTLDLLGDEDFLRSIIGVIWLSKRKAGEQLEVSDAAKVSFSDFSIEADEADETDEDPKALGAVVPA